MSYSQLMALAEQLRFCASHSCMDCELVMDDSKCLVKNLDELADYIEFLANIVARSDEEWEIDELLGQ